MAHAPAGRDLKNNARSERALICSVERKLYVLYNLACRLLQPRERRGLFLVDRDRLVCLSFWSDREFYDHFATFVCASRGIRVKLYEISALVSLGDRRSDGGYTGRSSFGSARVIGSCASVRHAKRKYGDRHCSKRMHTDV